MKGAKEGGGERGGKGEKGGDEGGGRGEKGKQRKSKKKPKKGSCGRHQKFHNVQDRLSLKFRGLLRLSELNVCQVSFRCSTKGSVWMKKGSNSLVFTPFHFLLLPQERHFSPSLGLCPSLLHPRYRIWLLFLYSFMPLMITQCSNLSRSLCKSSCPSRASPTLS